MQGDGWRGGEQVEGKEGAQGGHPPATLPSPRQAATQFQVTPHGPGTKVSGSRGRVQGRTFHDGHSVLSHVTATGHMWPMHN